MVQTHQLTISNQSGKQAIFQYHIGSRTLQSGELVVLLGSNGIGKSTLLRTLAGIQKPLHGSVEIGGKNLHNMPLSQKSRSITYVGSIPSATEYFTVWQWVSFGRMPYTNWRGQLSPTDKQLVDKAIADIGIEHLAHKQVTALSDGERQRVALARALAQDTELILLDEPSAFLDISNRIELIVLLKKIANQGKCILFSSHDLQIALSEADRIWLITPDAMHDGSPEDILFNGHIEDAFARNEIQFDAATCEFSHSIAQRGSIAVSDTDPRAFWIRKALIRSGFEITTSSEIQAGFSPENQTYFLHYANQTNWATNLYGLVQNAKGYKQP
jgi:iron complex transport system ATP-binding protein